MTVDLNTNIDFFLNLKSLEATLCAVLLAGIVWVLKMIAFRDEDKSYKIYENI